MNKVISLLVLIYMSGCSVIGGEIGRAMDESAGTGGDEYETMLAEQGMETDIEILKTIYNNLDNEKVAVEESDNIACREPTPRQICTALKGCWCE